MSSPSASAARRTARASWAGSNGWPARQAVGFCMKKDGDICLVAPGSTKCLAISSSDTAPVLMSLGAEAVLVASQEERRVKLAELYRDDGIDYVSKRSDEVLQGLLIPREAL